MRKIVAFAGGLLIATLVAFSMAWWGNNNPADYAFYCAAWFALTFSFMLIVSYSPEIYLAWLGALDRVAFLKLETARKYKELDNLSMPTILDNSPKPKVVFDRAAKWQDWYISVFEWAGDTIKFDKHLDEVMTYDLWRKVLCKALMDYNPPLIEPVQGGNRTEFRGGLTGPAIATLLKSGMLVLPHPAEYDPPPRLPPKTNAEMRQKGDETPKTQYAKDVDRGG